MKAQTSILYDADAEQIVPFTLQHNQKSYTLQLIVAPFTDDDFITYSLKVKQHEKTVGVDGEQLAATWLWNLIARQLTGMQGETPSDWKDRIAASDKEGCLDNCLLAHSIELGHAPAVEELLPWTYAEEKESGVLYHLTVFFNGKPVVTKHTIAPFSKEKARECWTELRKERPDYQELGAILDFNRISSEGYAGRVPLHHKVVLLVAHLGYERVALGKN